MKKIAGLIIAAFVFFSCASAPSSNSKTEDKSSRQDSDKERRMSEERWQRELARRERLKKEREEKRRRRALDSIEAEQREALKKEKRLALLKKQEERRKREARRIAEKKTALQKKREEEERRRKEAERRKREERRKKQKRIAQKLQSRYDSGTFWARDAERLSRTRILAEGNGKGVLAIYANPKRLQLQGITYARRRWSLSLGDETVVPEGSYDLTGLLLQRRGNFLLLQAPQAFPQKKPTKQSYQYLSIRLSNRNWTLLNISSDGEDLLWLDLESQDERRDFRRVVVQELLVAK